LEIEPELAQARFNLAKAYRTEKHINRALDAFHEVVRLKPDFTEAYDELASIYDDLSQLDKAVFYYEKSPELKPDCWTSCFNLGNLYRRQGLFVDVSVPKALEKFFIKTVRDVQTSD
jgi:protein O-GlcNAc transferase